jgi:hypothetical protein
MLGDFVGETLFSFPVYAFLNKHLFTDTDIVGPHDAAVPVGEDEDLGLPAIGFCFVELGEGHDDEKVADFALVGGCAVQRYRLCSLGCLDGIGLETLTVGDVGHEDFFVAPQPDLLHQRRVDRQAAFVVKGPIRHFSPEELGLEKGDFHNAKMSLAADLSKP